MMLGGVDDYERGPCLRCGCHTVDEAGASAKCRPMMDQTGEYVCGHSENDIDADGYFLHPTAEALERLDAWCGAEARRMDCSSPPHQPLEGQETLKGMEE